MLQSKTPKKTKLARTKGGAKEPPKVEKIRARASRSGTKQGAVLALLRQPAGATIAAMMKATGWQQHSVRGFLAGVVRKRLKLKLGSKKVDGDRVYRIASGAAGKVRSAPVQAPVALSVMPRVKIGPALPDRKTLDVEIARLRDLDVGALRSPLAYRVRAASAPSPAPPSAVSCSGLPASGRSVGRPG